MIRDIQYRCNTCGHVFDRPTVCLGDRYQPDCYECPSCHGDDYEPVFECSRCGELFNEEDLYYGICEGCLRELAKDKELAFAYGEKNKCGEFYGTGGGELNGLIAFSWDATDANNELFKSITEQDAVEYCMEDKYQFASFVREYDV